MLPLNRPMLDQLQMLGSICGGSEEEGWQQLPRGVELLSFLLKVPYYSHMSAKGLLNWFKLGSNCGGSVGGAV